MGKSILILDDDADFNNLLTDIFVQADYDVTSQRDPETAIGVFRDKHFDLVVTDQKMPGLSGEEFIREIKALKSDVPVIMVSGYLDNETIRGLIKDGVGGVFLKPLNVFSLLKRTAVLIEESEAAKQRKTLKGENEKRTEALQFQHQLPFAFNTFPCKAPKSLEFAKKLNSLRNFKANLIVIGESGTDFVGVIDDLKHFDEGGQDYFAFMSANEFRADVINQRINDAEVSGANRITFVIVDTQILRTTQKRLVINVAKKEGEFADLHTDIRYIFCLHEDIDSLYDKGEIDDDIYMFMGTSEVKVPALREIRDDIPIMAYRFLKDDPLLADRPNPPVIDTTAKVFLHERDWSGNAVELKRLMEATAKSLKGSAISRDVLEDALKELNQMAASSGNEGLQSKLLRYRNDYSEAFLLLNGGDKQLTAELLGIEQPLLEQICSKNS